MALKFKHKAAIKLLNLISKTWRIKVDGNIPEKPGIVAFWHGSMLPVWRFFKGNEPVGVVSLSKDGEILSQLLKIWGYKLIRGSSSKKGDETLQEIQAAAKEKLVLITPDGPRGPAKKFKAGAVVASQRTGVPIYLCNVKAGSRWVFRKSWDNFILPPPFSIINLHFSEPIFISENSDREQINSYIVYCENELLKTNELRTEQK